MQDVVQDLTRGNATEVKVVLTCVVGALAVYQLVLISVGYQVVRLPFLAWGPATFAHRFTGQVIVAITAIIAAMCLLLFGFDDDGGAHAVSGAGLLGALALKVLVVRTAGSSSRALPWLGTVIFALFAITCWTSVSGYFGED